MILPHKQKNPIFDFLTKIGHQPVKITKKGWLFQTPYRSDASPCLWVERKRNIWRDLETGQHGDMDDLGVACFKVTDLGDALNCLDVSNMAFSVPDNTNLTARFVRNDQIEILNEAPLSNWRLLRQLRTLCVDIALAKVFCVELSLKFDRKRINCVGFKNRSNGYVGMNDHLRLSVSPPDISLIHTEANNDLCYLFVDFIDFLSFLTLQMSADMLWVADGMNYMVLNSLANVNKAIVSLIDFKTVVCCLKNNDEGRETIETLSEYLDDVHDASEVYAGYNDLNEFLIDTRKKGGAK